MSSYGTFAAYYDALTKNVRYAERAEALDGLIRKWLEEPMPEHILVDLACGTGSLSEEMAKRGWDVIGIDGSMEMLNEALDKKYDSGLPIQYLQQDMRALDLFGTVCVTLCTLDSINHLPTVQDVKRVFARVSLFAEPGGLFLFDVNTAYKHRNLLGEQCFVYELPDAVCVWQNHLHADEPELPVDIQLDFFEQLEGNKYRRITEQFTERVWSDSVIRRLLDETGLDLLEMLDGDTYAAPTPESQRMLYIAKSRKQTV